MVCDHACVHDFTWRFLLVVFTSISTKLPSFERSSGVDSEY